MNSFQNKGYTVRTFFFSPNFFIRVTPYEVKDHFSMGMLSPLEVFTNTFINFKNKEMWLPWCHLWQVKQIWLIKVFHLSRNLHSVYFKWRVLLLFIKRSRGNSIFQASKCTLWFVSCSVRARLWFAPEHFLEHFCTYGMFLSYCK